MVARADKGGEVRDRRLGVDLHEQTGLSTGAVTDNNELSSNLGHGVVCDGVIEDGGGLSKSVMEVVSIWMEDWR